MFENNENCIRFEKDSSAISSVLGEIPLSSRYTAVSDDHDFLKNYDVFTSLTSPVSIEWSFLRQLNIWFDFRRFFSFCKGAKKARDKKSIFYKKKRSF